ncbi:metal ABC transporter ATP-binding protein [Candidatus Shapirobacteria bacterium]|nr:metal ABC transporter ATP-binding protein [Candidatus Shapirobacteria bacterium]
MSSIVEIKNLSVRYGATIALQNISCQIEQGDFVGLVGPNGGGKTTLAKTILGLLPPHEGKIALFGQDSREFDEWQKIGYLPQKHTSINPLFPASVGEVVSLGLLSAKKRPKNITTADWQEIDALLKDMGIFDLKSKLISQVSGGQQQKVMLARALISKPEILILDEPSTALDPNSREQFFARLEKLNKEAKTTIILITHDTGYIGQYANKLLYIDRKLVFFGNISEFCPKGKDIASCFEKKDGHIIWHQHS